eukprot:6178617-Pleurochrysis_carterae.AAC.2
MTSFAVGGVEGVEFSDATVAVRCALSSLSDVMAHAERSHSEWHGGGSSIDCFGGCAIPKLQSDVFWSWPMSYSRSNRAYRWRQCRRTNPAIS